MMVHGLVAATSELETSWGAALADAGLTSDDATLFVVEPGRSKVPEATTLVRGRSIDVGLPHLDEYLNDFDAPWFNTHRVLLFAATRPVEIEAALVRHELQHGLQFDACESVLDLANLAEEVVRHGNSFERASLYNRIPSEVNANAAAHHFLAATYRPERIVELRSVEAYRVLLIGGEMDDLDRLPGRILEFLAQLPNLTASYVRAGSIGVDVDSVAGFASILDIAVARGTGANWRARLAETRDVFRPARSITGPV